MAKNYELGNLVWKVTGDTANFDKNLGTSQTKLSKFGTAAAAAGKKLTTFVTLPLAALGLGALKASSDLAESANAVSVVFGDSAKVIDKWGETAATSAGLTQASFNGIATIIGAQLKQSGLDIDDVAVSTIDLTQRAADLASVFNTDVSDAAGALGAALRGESEPARRYAINLSEAAVQAEALSSGLIRSKSEMTDQIKVQARLNLIMKQSNDVAGDFQNTSDGLANRTRILKSEIVNIAAELGNQLVPIAEDVLEVVGDLVHQFSDLDDGTKKLILQLAFVAGSAGPLLRFVGGAIKAG
nr:phage tail tape measure protein [Spirochaetia bacterium]